MFSSAKTLGMMADNSFPLAIVIVINNDPKNLLWYVFKIDRDVYIHNERLYTISRILT